MALGEPLEDEMTFEVDGIRIASPQWAKAFVEGATIDYVRREKREGFTISPDKKWRETPRDDDW